MANDGKNEQWGAGSRRAPQQRAERAARRSQKRAGERRAMKIEAFGREAAHGLGFPGAFDEPRSPAYDAMAILHVAAWEFGRSLQSLCWKVAYPDDSFTSIHRIEP